MPRTVPNLLAVSALALLLAGCKIAPPSGDQSSDAVTPPPNPDAVAAPGNLDVTPTPANAGIWDGTYAGEGRLAGGVGCPSRAPGRTIMVQYNYVSFGNYTGPIAANGSVVLSFGDSFINGTFANGRFTGDLIEPTQGCKYHLEFRRA
jgi:hypothetical protein